MLSCYGLCVVFFLMKTSQNKLKFMFIKVHVATSKVHNSSNLRG
jgi:hypothetical protein